MNRQGAATSAPAVISWLSEATNFTPFKASENISFSLASADCAEAMSPSCSSCFSHIYSRATNRIFMMLLLLRYHPGAHSSRLGSAGPHNAGHIFILLLFSNYFQRHEVSGIFRTHVMLFFRQLRINGIQEQRQHACTWNAMGAPWP